MKILSLLFLFSLAIVSCQKIETPVKTGNPDIIGNWVSPQYADTLIVYARADKLVENEIGFTINPNNTLIYRQNSGWCGTPPVTTADYAGTWNWNDSIIKITTAYWGGTFDLTWKIISLTHRELVVSVIKSEYHEGK